MAKSKIWKSRKFRLPQILILIVTQDLKTPKKRTETKTKRFRYYLEQQQQKISEISKFSILPYAQNRKLGNLGNFSFSSNFDGIFFSQSLSNPHISWLRNFSMYS